MKIKIYPDKIVLHLDNKLKKISPSDIIKFKNATNCITGIEIKKKEHIQFDSTAKYLEGFDNQQQDLFTK